MRTAITVAKAIAALSLVAVLAHDARTACGDGPSSQPTWLGMFAASKPSGAAPTTAPASSSRAAAASNGDKNGYTLFHPTPANLMRPMDLDRPNITNTPHTVDAGHVQVETGLADFTHVHNHAGRSDTWDLGQFNVRTGILNNLELNVIANSYRFLEGHDSLSGQTTRANGYGDTVLGGKLNLWGNDSGAKLWATALGIQPQVKLPTAGRVLGNGWTEALVNFPFLMNMPAGVHLGLMTTPLLERNSSNTSYCAGWLHSVCVDRVFFKRYDFYVEYVSHVATGHQEGQGSVDLGVIYSVSPNVSLDTAVNIGVNQATPAAEWLVGITFRL